MTRRGHIAIVVVLLALLVLAFVLYSGSDETAPEQSTPPTATATP